MTETGILGRVYLTALELRFPLVAEVRTKKSIALPIESFEPHSHW